MNQRRAAEAQSQKRYEKEILCFYAVLCSDNFDSIETDSQGEQRGVKKFSRHFILFLKLNKRLLIKLKLFWTAKNIF